MLNGEKNESARMQSLKCFLITNIEFNKNDTCGLETYFWIFLTLDSYYLKLQPNYKIFLKVFSFVANQRLYLKAKANYESLFILKITSQNNLLLLSFINFSVNSTVNPIMLKIRFPQSLSVSQIIRSRSSDTAIKKLQ